MNAIDQQPAQPPRPLDLTADQEALIKRINEADVARLQAIERSGIQHPCAIRDYIAGEAAPLEDRGAIRTFITLYGIGCYARTFITSVGIIGHSLDTYLDTTLPGVQEVVVETKESFDPHEHARFVQATLNQQAIRQTGPLPFGRPRKKKR